MKRTDVNVLFEKSLMVSLFESFKDYKTKQLSLGESEEDIDSVVEDFKKRRERLSPPYNDIGYWMRKPLEELQDHLKQLPSSKNSVKKNKHNIDTEKIKQSEDLQLIYEDDRWVAVYVKNFYGSRELCSMTTDWCVTKEETYWNRYSNDGYFIFAFDKDREPYNIHTQEGDPLSKLAIQIDYSQRGVMSVYDAPDNEIGRSILSELKTYPFYDEMFDVEVESIDSEAFEEIIKETEVNENNHYFVEMTDSYDEEDYLYASLTFSYTINIYDFEGYAGELQAQLKRYKEDTKDLYDLLDVINDDVSYRYCLIYTNDNVNFDVYGDIEDEDNIFERNERGLDAFRRACNYYKKEDEDVDEEEIKQNIYDYFVELGIFDESPDRNRYVPDDPRQLKFKFAENRIKTDKALLEECYKKVLDVSKIQTRHI